MRLEILLAVSAGLAVALALVSRPLRRAPMTEPLAALLVGVVIGPMGLSAVVLDQPTGATAVEISARLVLAVSLMAVALRFSLEAIKGSLRELAVLLSVVLVGMAVITAGLAGALLGAGLGTAALLGTALAPTDPVLASSVVEGDAAARQLPARLRIQLSIESGANDGFAAALVAVGVALAAGLPLGTEVLRALAQAGGAVGVGVALGAGTGKLLVVAERHEDLEEAAFLAFTIALAMLALGIGELLNVESLVAVFFAGLAYNWQISGTDRYTEWEVQEAINRYLVLPVFVVFGVVLPWQEWGELGWAGIGFAAATLLLRRVPLTLALARPLQLSTQQAAFLGWFGPIGAAALLYLAVNYGNGVIDDAAWAAGTLVVAASTLLHGVTAAPGRALLAHVEDDGD